MECAFDFIRTTSGILMSDFFFSITGLIAQQPIGVAGEGWKAPEKEFKPLIETVKVLH